MKVESLKLSDAKAPSILNASRNRRTRVAEKLREQKRKAEAIARGEGVEGRLWHWKVEDGTYRLSLIYGRSAVKFADGKYSVVCHDLNEVAATFEQLADGVEAGWFDVHLEAHAKALREQFRKPRSKSQKTG